MAYPLVVDGDRRRRASLALLEIVEGRTAKAASAWIHARPKAWRDDIDWVTLDLSGPYRKAFEDSLPDATQITDPFHVIKSANTNLIDGLLDPDHPPEVRGLGRTLRRPRHQVRGWHQAKVSNGPTEAANNLTKRIKRIGFGFRRFAYYRLRVLLYAGQPNWDRLATLTPR